MQRSGDKARPAVRGKFLYRGEQKLYVRGATYGTFRPRDDGALYPPPSAVARDFAQMASSGFNAVRTYTTPPRWLLDLAGEHELLVMAGTAWEQHVDFLAERSRARAIEDRVRSAVAGCAGHPAVLSHVVGNEIPSHMVRWLGRQRVERYIKRLYRAAKEVDPQGLVTYVNYPPTEYLQLPFLDFVCFNVYLEQQGSLEAYLARLHNITGDRPLVMAEIGLDSRRHGELVQAGVLDWQIKTAFASGCAGAFVFAWTDDWYVSYLSELTAGGGVEMDDWDFGLTRRDRSPKPALHAARAAFEAAPLADSSGCPCVSVVVCTFNGERTIDDCLTGLAELDYPDYEVIVVDDGSTDATPAIVAKHDVALMRIEHAGLATARNVGMNAAIGEIVAYIDDDARPDPQWARYLVEALRSPQYAGAGGPNLPPPDTSTLGRCIAAAPGSPTHVLISDREAEHLPGCNMAFRKSALELVGGFDPQFHVAGDDVDVCWRLMEAGCKLAFSPAAVVWHRPRTSMRAYWRQQRGYGRAEAMLERQWPNKYAVGGRARWAGRIYGNGRHSLRRGRVYFGTWGSALFQSLYRSRPSRVSLLGTPEGNRWATVLALISLVGLVWAPLLMAAPVLLAALLVAVGLAAAGASDSRPPASRPSRGAHALTWCLSAVLHVVQPLARNSGRIGAAHGPRAPGKERFAFPRRRVFSVWTEAWQSGERRLGDLEARLRARGAIVARGGVFDDWDLQVRGSSLAAARVRFGVEEHGAGRQLVRVALLPWFSRDALLLVALFVSLSLGAFLDGAHIAGIVLAGAAVAVGALAIRAAGFAVGAVVRACEGERARARREVHSVNVETT
jgi:GT2 family glycosyltransferase